MHRLLMIGLLALSGFVPQTWANTAKEYTLDNGLKVIIKPDHRAPVVVNQICYKVGSSYEPAGLTGVSHVLEHMMFKGTRNYPGDEFSQRVARNGGRENAYTSYDYTCYFQKIAADRLPIVMQLEADRMRHLKLDANEFAKEIQVVMEERRMRIDNQPQSLTYERFAAAAHLSSPYHHPIIGWMNDLENLKSADLQTWYEQWYAPNNAILTIIGDIDTDKALALAKKYYGHYKTSAIPTLKPQQEPKPVGSRQIEVQAPAKVPLLILGYNTPSLKTVIKTKDAYALEVLTGILAGGNSARLPTRLVRQQKIAASADAHYQIYRRFSGLLTLNATPTAQRSITELKTALEKEIHTLKTTFVSREELDRVKHQVVAANVYAKDSLFYQAMRYGNLEAIGLSWRADAEYAKKIQQITAQDIQKVAKKYLTAERLTVAVLKPLPLNKKDKQ